MTNEELLPCPFCGTDNATREPVDEDDVLDVVQASASKLFYVQCPGCGADGPSEMTIEAAEQGWNKRARAAQQPDGTGVSVAARIKTHALSPRVPAGPPWCETNDGGATFEHSRACNEITAAIETAERRGADAERTACLALVRRVLDRYGAALKDVGQYIFYGRHGAREEFNEAIGACVGIADAIAARGRM